jgi:hypothetical protein
MDLFRTSRGVLLNVPTVTSHIRWWPHLLKCNASLEDGLNGPPTREVSNASKNVKWKVAILRDIVLAPVVQNATLGSQSEIRNLEISAL